MIVDNKILYRAAKRLLALSDMAVKQGKIKVAKELAAESVHIRIAIKELDNG